MVARRCRWLCVSMLLLVVVVAPSLRVEAQALLLAQSAVARLVTGQLPDSVRLKIFTAMAKGEMEAVGSAYLTHKGLHDAPQWLRAFQNVYTVANRQMGRCKQVAETIYAAFKEFGAKPEYVKIFSTGKDVEHLSWQSRTVMSNNNFHIAVRYGDRVYDAFTGLRGMLEAEYLAAIHAQGTLKVVVMEAP
jgi:hypothetical protein